MVVTPDQARLSETLGWGSDLITIVASFFFLFSFCRLKEKTVGHYMILILSISDLAIPVNHMIGLIFQEEEMYPKVFFPLMTTVLHFSLYWAAAMAYFTYLVIVKKMAFNVRKFALNGFLVCLILCPYCALLPNLPFLQLKVTHLGKGVATVTYATSNHWLRLIDWIIYDVFGTLAPVIMIAFCYNNLKQSMKSSFVYSPYISRNPANSARIQLYIAIPIICFVPIVGLHFINIFFDNEYPFGVTLFLATLRRIWGFLNLLAYWFFKPEKQGGSNENSSLLEDSEDKHLHTTRAKKMAKVSQHC